MRIGRRTFRKVLPIVDGVAPQTQEGLLHISERCLVLPACACEHAAIEYDSFAAQS